MRVRQPPILGAVGTDIGEKPAISFVIPPKREKPQIPGCTNPSSPNYNPLATIDDGSCGGCDDPCAVRSISVQGTMTGTVSSGEECGEVDIDISATCEEVICDSPADCVVQCQTAETPIIYECPEECAPVEERIFQFTAGLTCGGEGDDWFLIIGTVYGNLTEFCGRTSPLGSAEAVEMNLGPDPEGTWVIAPFDDGDTTTVSYELTVVIVTIP